jgi:hypothetical protein
MEAERFWELLERLRRSSERPAARRKELARLTPDELLALAVHFDRLTDAAHTVDLWGAAYLINGGASDDGFYYFCVWLVWQGRKVYEAALADPDSLADVVDPEEEYESDDSLRVAEVWQAKTGRTEEEYYEALQQLRGEQAGLRGEDWDFDDDDEARRRLPRLARMYLEGSGPDGK